jgi:hypothetical protein
MLRFCLQMIPNVCSIRNNIILPTPILVTFLQALQSTFLPPSWRVCVHLLLYFSEESYHSALLQYIVFNSFSCGAAAQHKSGPFIVEISRSHTMTHHSRLDSSWWVISSSQRPLPVNTQHSQQTNIHAPCGIQTHHRSSRRRAP